MKPSKYYEHLIIGYESDNIVFVRHKTDWGFDYLPRLGYNANREISPKNNLLRLAHKTKKELLNPLRKNIWQKLSLTVISSTPLNKNEIVHLYEFCKTVGSVNISLVQVSSVIEFLKCPHYQLIKAHYMVTETKTAYAIRSVFFDHETLQ